VASLDELIDEIQQVNDKLDEAVSAASSAENSVEEVQSLFAALGAEGQVAYLAEIKDGIESWRAQIQSTVETGHELIERAKAAKG
jgi:ATP-dependent RNA circularization protein (DNA/RNA ligase family)